MSFQGQHRTRRAARLVTHGWSAIPVVLVMFGVLAGFAPPAGAGPASNDAEQQLAVVNAGGGTLRKAGEGYRLTLEQVVPRAVWFSDRPSRDAGSYAIDELEEAFFAGDDPPNAALEVFAGRGAGGVYVFEVSNPRYKAQARRLVLDARVLGGDAVASTALDGYADRVTDDPPARFGTSALFIDDASPACSAGFWGGPDGAISEMNNIDCLEAQAVIAQGLAQHPANTGADQYDYDFAFFTETWHVYDQQQQAEFTRTDHQDDPNTHQSFHWEICSNYGGNTYC